MSMTLGSDARDMDLASRRPRGTPVVPELNMRSLEDVLGPSAGRYFGHGYRGVRYGVKSSACLDGDPSQVSAEVHATYPPHWSIDSDGTPRRPHLSSIDATVLPLLVFEAANGHRRNQLSTRRVRVVELRAAGKPWLELDAIPVTLNVDVGHAGETLTSVVGNIRSRIVLTDEPHPAALSNADVAPQYPLTVYGGLFQTGECRSLVSTSEALDGILHGRHEFSVSEFAERPAPGIEADFWPSPTVVDYLVTMGQLAQALIYACGETDRSSIGTLWMRTMTLTIDEPSPQFPAAFETTTRLVGDRILDRGGRRLHDLVIESSATTGARVRASLAYEEVGET